MKKRTDRWSERITSLAIALCVALPALPGRAATGFQGSAEILGIDVGNTGYLILRLNQVNTCGGSLVQVPQTAAFYKDMLVSAQLAYVNQQPINVWVDSCTGQIGNIVRMETGVVW